MGKPSHSKQNLLSSFVIEDQHKKLSYVVTESLHFCPRNSSSFSSKQSRTRSKHHGTPMLYEQRCSALLSLHLLSLCQADLEPPAPIARAHECAFHNVQKHSTKQGVNRAAHQAKNQQPLGTNRTATGEKTGLSRPPSAATPAPIAALLFLCQNRSNQALLFLFLCLLLAAKQEQTRSCRNSSCTPTASSSHTE